MLLTAVKAQKSSSHTHTHTYSRRTRGGQASLVCAEQVSFTPSTPLFFFFSYDSLVNDINMSTRKEKKEKEGDSAADGKKKRRTRRPTGHHSGRVIIFRLATLFSFFLLSLDIPVLLTTSPLDCGPSTLVLPSNRL